MRVFVISIFFFLYFSAFSQKDVLHTYAANSVLKSGTWCKLKVNKDGVYKITYDDLVQYGISPASIDPRNIRIFGNGGEMLPEYNGSKNNDDLIENAIYVEGESDGHFDRDDYILFYGRSTVKWVYDYQSKMYVHSVNLYADESCYFLTYDNGAGKRIQLQNSSASMPNYNVTTYDDYDFHEKDSINFLKSGKEWFGEYFDAVNFYSFNFAFPDIDLQSRSTVKASIAARNLSESLFNLSVSGETKTITVKPISGQSTSDYAQIAEDTMSFFPTDSLINISVEKITQASLGWLNYLEINVKRKLQFQGHQLFFRSIESVSDTSISGFSLSNANSSLQIWDVTDPFNATNQLYNLTGTNISFTIPTDTLKQFIAFDNTQFYSPVYDGKVSNQNLHALSKKDMIIVTYPDFIDEANRIAAIHSSLDNFSVVVVTPQEIYNEFSSGIQDVAAIRNFLRMLYDRGSSETDKPKYLLLFGRASYDYKNRIKGNKNLVPAYESENSTVMTSSYVTDDFFGLLDSTEGSFSNGALDIGIGRFPVDTKEDAKVLVDKVVQYLKKKCVYSEVNGGTTYTREIAGDWRNRVCFIADDEDNNLHLQQAEELANIVDTTYKKFNVEKIYLDAYVEVHGPQGDSYPEVTNEINKTIEKGVSLINYTGHGGETGWASEKVIQLSDINNWKNIYNMPVFVTATCEFSRFDDPSRISAGEYILLNPNGGGIGLFSTTRIAFSNTNFSLNKSFCKFAFIKTDNGFYRFGDIIRLAKIDNNSNVNIRNFALLGDPALKLAYPDNTVITTLINGYAANLFSDTLKAMSKITISGIIQDIQGNKLTNFNGIIYPTVFDKKYITTTLANDEQSSPKDFTQQNNILFQGKARVVNGDFSFTFILPKETKANYGIGKISYYAISDDSVGASGYYEGSNFIIGGKNMNALCDTSGPKIRLFMNDTSFISGGTTDENPLLLAYIEDSTGINRLGNAIGHNIKGVLDENINNSIDLDDFYIPDINSYKKGKVFYPFSSLTEGNHTLSISVWDVNDNSSTSTTEFFVLIPKTLTIKNIFNYPNPFEDKTYFYFDNNFTNAILEVDIKIFSITGMLVKTIQEKTKSVGKHISAIEWNGCSDGGKKLENGMYIYKINVKTAEGSVQESSNKLIILKKQ